MIKNSKDIFKIIKRKKREYIMVKKLMVKKKDLDYILINILKDIWEIL